MTKGPDSWWKSALVYEIAPISFQDSNGDGKGDLPGLLSRIEYLKWLGVGAVWLTPIYKSPFRDLGYDISDYCTVDRAFGSLEDVDRLIAKLHQAGIRLILDLVPNHTSSDHGWFFESRSSRENSKADWYIWAEPADNGGPPNNWLSRFGGSLGMVRSERPVSLSLIPGRTTGLELAQSGGARGNRARDALLAR